MIGTQFSLFLLAALVIAAVPGPGIFYVAARTLSGGKQGRHRIHLRHGDWRTCPR